MDSIAFTFNHIAHQTALHAGQAQEAADACGATTLADDFPWHRIRRLYRK